MSREAYQMPMTQGSSTPAAGTNNNNSSSSGGGGYGAAAGAVVGADSAGGAGITISYICGDCGIKFQLQRGGMIRCVDCGCRVLYKERTKRMVQFEAR